MIERDSVKDVLANVRRAAIEDCARVAESHRNEWRNAGGFEGFATGAKVIADDIRGLITKASTPIPLTPSDEMVDAGARAMKWEQLELRYQIEIGSPDKLGLDFEDLDVARAALTAALNLMGGDK